MNLIGEHTDYNDGFVMPFALEQRVRIAAAPRDDGRWQVSSLNQGSTESFGADDLRPGMSGWQAYVAGVVWALEQAGHPVGGADLVLASDVPVGAGLSSSAALECAVLTALADLNSLDIGGLDRARLAQRCENEFVGAPTGLMDQAASILCTADHALFFDCRSYDADQVALDLPGAGLELLVLDTKTPHDLVDSEYAARRASCEEACRILGLAALRDVDDLDAALGRLTDPVMRQRVRHVVTENDRVRDAAEVLRAGQIRALAPLLDASHASMRDDFEITVPQVDLAVEAARSAGALGGPDDRRRLRRLHHRAGRHRRGVGGRRADRSGVRPGRLRSTGALRGPAVSRCRPNRLTSSASQRSVVRRRRSSAGAAGRSERRSRRLRGRRPPSSSDHRGSSTPGAAR